MFLLIWEMLYRRCCRQSWPRFIVAVLGGLHPRWVYGESYDDVIIRNELRLRFELICTQHVVNGGGGRGSP